MSEKEKTVTGSALEALTRLTEAKGEEYVSGLIDGINLGTAAEQSPTPADGE